MEFFKSHVLFRLKNAILTKAYRMNLQTTESLCSFFIVPFQVSWKEEQIVECKGKLRLALTSFLYKFHLARTLHFLVFLALRSVGIQKTPSGEYKFVDKLLDYGWLGPILCTVLFRIEFNRKKKETVQMMNGAYELEREAESDGNY